MPLEDQELDPNARYPKRNRKPPDRLLNPIVYFGKAFFIFLAGLFSTADDLRTPYSYSQVIDSLKDPSGATEQLYHHMNIINMNNDGTFNDIHPLSNIAKNESNDTFYLHQAMKLPDAEKFIEAMENEILDHERSQH